MKKFFKIFLILNLILFFLNNGFSDCANNPTITTVDGTNIITLKNSCQTQEIENFQNTNKFFKNTLNGKTPDLGSSINSENYTTNPTGVLTTQASNDSSINFADGIIDCAEGWDYFYEEGSPNYQKYFCKQNSIAVGGWEMIDFGKTITKTVINVLVSEDSSKTAQGDYLIYTTDLLEGVSTNWDYKGFSETLRGSELDGNNDELNFSGTTMFRYLFIGRDGTGSHAGNPTIHWIKSYEIDHIFGVSNLEVGSSISNAWLKLENSGESYFFENQYVNSISNGFELNFLNDLTSSAIRGKYDVEVIVEILNNLIKTNYSYFVNDFVSVEIFDSKIINYNLPKIINKDSSVSFSLFFENTGDVTIPQGSTLIINEEGNSSNTISLTLNQDLLSQQILELSSTFTPSESFFSFSGGFNLNSPGTSYGILEIDEVDNPPNFVLSFIKTINLGSVLNISVVPKTISGTSTNTINNVLKIYEILDDDVVFIREENLGSLTSSGVIFDLDTTSFGCGAFLIEASGFKNGVIGTGGDFLVIKGCVE